MGNPIFSEIKKRQARKKINKILPAVLAGNTISTLPKYKKKLIPKRTRLNNPVNFNIGSGIGQIFGKPKKMFGPFSIVNAGLFTIAGGIGYFAVDIIDNGASWLIPSTLRKTGWTALGGVLVLLGILRKQYIAMGLGGGIIVKAFSLKSNNISQEATELAKKATEKGVEITKEVYKNIEQGLDSVLKTGGTSLEEVKAVSQEVIGDVFFNQNQLENESARASLINAELHKAGKDTNAIKRALLEIGLINSHSLVNGKPSMADISLSPNYWENLQNIASTQNGIKILKETILPTIKNWEKETQTKEIAFLKSFQNGAIPIEAYQSLRKQFTTEQTQIIDPLINAATQILTQGSVAPFIGPYQYEESPGMEADYWTNGGFF